VYRIHRGKNKPTFFFYLFFAFPGTCLPFLWQAYRQRRLPAKCGIPDARHIFILVAMNAVVYDELSWRFMALDRALLAACECPPQTLPSANKMRDGHV
jgi:hypothetical protein